MSTAPTTLWRVADVHGLRDVYDAVFAEVYQYASRLAGADRQGAEDVVHDVFVDLARRIGCGEQLDVSVGWFITAVRHRFIDQMRRQATEQSSRQRMLSAPAIESASDVSSSSDSLLVGLSDLDRLVLVMHHVDGCSVREVAKAIGRSRRATESVLARARDRARRLQTGGSR